MTSNALKTTAYQQGEEREQLILQHLPQIKYIAQRIAVGLPAHVELEDLVSAGVIGLMDALEKFDKSKGVQFKTYAEVRIHGAILDSLRVQDWAPRSLRRKIKEVGKAYAKVEQQLGRAASDEDIARELGLEIGEFHVLLDQLKGLNIGHFQFAGPDNRGLDADNGALQYTPSREEDIPFQLCLRQELRSVLAELIEQLPERERLVITLYHYEELTMREVGEILGVNESRICQLHTRAMLRLRGKLQRKLRRKEFK